MQIDQTKAFNRLLDEMRAGSQDAAWELLRTYGPHIQAVVRRFLDRKMRTIYDSEDFAQSVWASLLRRQQSLAEVKDPQRFILAIARNKVIDEVRKRRRSIRHGVRQLVSIDTQTSATIDLEDKRPRPSEWAIAKEQWEAIMDGESGVSQAIIALRVSGATFQEIAEQTDISERTARRTIKRLLEKFGY